MIVIQKGVWRAEQIAAVDIEESTVYLLPVNASDFFDYEFEDEDEAVEAYKRLVAEWKAELERKGLS